MTTRVPGSPRVWAVVFIASLMAVLVLTLTPDSGGTQWFPGQDKVAHAIAFCWLLLSGSFASTKPTSIRWLVLLLLCYGGLIEVLQSFTGYRSAEWADFFADAAGLLGALGIRAGTKI